VFNPSERDGIAVPVTFVVNQKGMITYVKVENAYVRIRSMRLLREARNA
jgi:hypothetical protein